MDLIIFPRCQGKPIKKKKCIVFLLLPSITCLNMLIRAEHIALSPSLTLLVLVCEDCNYLFEQII